jgi:Heterokaryon incompatibility protein (HET)
MLNIVKGLAFTASTSFKTIGKILDGGPELEDFQYEPLPSPTAIRLLKVKKSASKDATIEISLETFRLENAPSYHALSYTWGDPSSWPIFELHGFTYMISPLVHSLIYKRSPFNVVKCNGKRIKVAENLFEALQHFADKDSDDIIPHGYIWADAICINQKNSPEKINQMHLMGYIYSGAVSVVVWLGRALTDTGLAMNAIHKLSELREDQHDTMDGLSITDESTYRTLGIDHVSIPEWRAFYGLASRAWFKLVWIIQEFLFAKSLIFAVGRYRIDPQTLCKVIVSSLIHGSWGLQISQLLQESFTSDIPPSFVDAAFLFSHALDLIRKLLRPIDILQAVRSRKSTSKNDYIYAMLNVVAIAMGVEPDNLPIAIDYEKPLETLLEEATLLCINSSEGLVTFSHLEQFKKEIHSNSASWTVDWTVPQDVVAFETLAKGSNSSWRPAGSMPMEIPDTSISHILKFRAAQFSTISVLSEEGSTMFDNVDFTSILELAISLEEPYKGPPGQSLKEIIGRTLVADSLKDGTTPVPLSDLPNWIYLLFLTGSIIRKATFNSKLRTMENLCLQLRQKYPDSMFPTDEEIESKSTLFFNRHPKPLYEEAVESVKSFMTNFILVLVGRRLAALNNGYIALVPVTAKKGDGVWMIPGRPAFYVLRSKANGNYEILGQSYVHGAMNGEGIQTVNFEEIMLE